MLSFVPSFGRQSATKFAEVAAVAAAAAAVAAAGKCDENGAKVAKKTQTNRRQQADKLEHFYFSHLLPSVASSSS